MRAGQFTSTAEVMLYAPTRGRTEPLFGGYSSGPAEHRSRKCARNPRMPGISLRLASYNLLEGLRPMGPGPGERRQLDRERTEAARSVVRELSPEVLVLNEALFCQQYQGH